MASTSTTIPPWKIFGTAHPRGVSVDLDFFGVDSLASPMSANEGLGQDVAGAGAYSMWNNHLYTDVTVYRSERAGALRLR